MKRAEQRNNEELTNTIEDIFECPVCCETVFNPVKCQQCEVFFCDDCQMPWKKRNNSCPACRTEPFNIIEVGKNERNILAAFIESKP